MTRRAFRLASLATGALALCGCVAAALPLAAGGLVGKSAADRQAPPAAQVYSPPVDAIGKRKAIPMPAPKPARTSEAADETPDGISATPRFAGELAPVGIPPSQLRSAPTPVPEKAAPITPPAAVRPLTATNPYAPFARYALEQAGMRPPAEARRSAILAAPGTLTPKRMYCASRPPAAIVDLDPQDGTFDTPVSATAANADLAVALAALRKAGVQVFWTSDLPTRRAQEVRGALVQAALDPEGRDALLLLRSGSDRKQLRREEISKTHCVVAIAGDRRGDFDEVFDYLRKPDAAQPLEALVGQGWFLAPPPLERAN